MKILYLGETAETSAEYLRDCLVFHKHEVELIDCHMDLQKISREYDVIIISDYPAEKIDAHNSREIIKQTENGSRFIMIGGWCSFNGFGKSYYQHPLAHLLSVELNPQDDRQNIHQGLIITPDPQFKSPEYLDWSNPPVICGYNEILPKQNAQVIVWAKPISSDGNKISFHPEQIPFLIKTKINRGCSLSCITDLAPHWCGGLVDWGTKRIKLNHVEIGDMYLQFVKFLLEI